MGGLESIFSTDEFIEPPQSAKQLDIRRCEVSTAVRLNAEWHSRVPIIDPSNIIRNRYYCCFLAEYQNTPYAVAIWSSPIAANRIKNGQSVLELRRLAIRDEAPKFTATRMIAQMTKYIRRYFPEVTRLISYQDTATHAGTIYKASNWTATTTSTLTDWTNRERNAPQTTATKIRWEYRLKEDQETVKAPKPEQLSFNLMDSDD